MSNYINQIAHCGLSLDHRSWLWSCKFYHQREYNDKGLHNEKGVCVPFSKFIYSHTTLVYRLAHFHKKKKKNEAVLRNFG